MAGIVFAKFTKPSHRGETIMFSKNALISLRNGSLYLMVRLEDRNTNANTNMNANANANAKANVLLAQLVRRQSAVREARVRFLAGPTLRVLK